jgi:hypothetical protein
VGWDCCKKQLFGTKMEDIACFEALNVILHIRIT